MADAQRDEEPLAGRVETILRAAAALGIRGIPCLAVILALAIIVTGASVEVVISVALFMLVIIVLTLVAVVVGGGS